MDALTPKRQRWEVIFMVLAWIGLIAILFSKCQGDVSILHG